MPLPADYDKWPMEAKNEARRLWMSYRNDEALWRKAVEVVRWKEEDKEMGKREILSGH